MFLYSLFSYQNRHFFMPAQVLEYVERRVANFITPLCWVKLRCLSAIEDLYGIRSNLQDLRLQNVASIL